MACSVLQSSQQRDGVMDGADATGPAGAQDPGATGGGPGPPGLVPEGTLDPGPDAILDSLPAEDLLVFVRQVTVHEDKDNGRGEYNLRFGAAGDDDLVGNRAATRWQGTVSNGESYEVLGWLGPVTVSTPGGVLSIACAGHEDDPVSDDTVLGGVARLGKAQEWGLGRWWRTENGPDCDFVFTVVRATDSPAAPVFLGQVT